MSGVEPTGNHVLEWMTGHLVEATTEMFSDYDFPLRRAASCLSLVDGGDRGLTLAAVIGYVGEGIRGALIMIAQETTIASWLAHMGLEGEPADTLGEFSNMVLGRLKTRLIREGLTLQVSTPTVASGGGLRLSMPPSPSACLAFDGPEWQIWLRLDAHLERGFVLKETKVEDVPAEAGDAFLF